MGVAKLQEEEFFTISEIAERLKISRFALYRIMSNEDSKKRLGFVYVGKSKRIPSSEFERYIRENMK